MANYKLLTPKLGAARKCLDPISDNVRNQVWMCPELHLYSNYEYFDAIYPIAIALSGIKAGWEGGVLFLKTIVFGIYYSFAFSKHNVCE